MSVARLSGSARMRDEIRTRGNVEFRRERDLLADLDDIVDLGVVQESLHMQNQYRRKSFNEHLLLCIKESSRPCRYRDLHRLRMRYVLQGITEGLDVLWLDVELQ